MSIWSAEEQEQLDYIEISTMQGATPITVRSPGVCEITGDGIPREWDVVKGFGIIGATQRFTGLGLAEFEVKIRVWEPGHRDQLAVFASSVQASPPGKPEKVYEIKNPRLAFKGITKCVFLNDPFPADEHDQSDTLTYKCRQWRKPLPTLTSPTSPGGASAAGAAADAAAQRLAERTAVFNNRLQILQGNTAPPGAR